MAQCMSCGRDIGSRGYRPSTVGFQNPILERAGSLLRITTPRPLVCMSCAISVEHAARSRVIVAAAGVGLLVLSGAAAWYTGLGDRILPRAARPVAVGAPAPGAALGDGSADGGAATAAGAPASAAGGVAAGGVAGRGADGAAPGGADQGSADQSGADQGSGGPDGYGRQGLGRAGGNGGFGDAAAGRPVGLPIMAQESPFAGDQAGDVIAFAGTADAPALPRLLARGGWHGKGSCRIIDWRRPLAAASAPSTPVDRLSGF